MCLFTGCNRAKNGDTADANLPQARGEAQKSIPGPQLSAQPGGITYLDTVPTIHIATTLTNPTADTLHFVSMSCSYEDMFVTNTPNYKVTSRYDCYKNYPEVIALPPHAKLDQFIIIRPTAKTVNVISSKIKVGMYYIIPEKGNEFEGIIKQYENRQAAKILWSEELDLKRLYHKVYK
ncbi:hypothetical protein ACLI09_07485 [Flavobacterium sp. RHBU_24]|uniref:hypothetical protein n=1 Tax=Flavobacterium sp. RHBU_24 TaxID=3391185 RepID=UPI0039854708